MNTHATTSPTSEVLPVVPLRDAVPLPGVEWSFYAGRPLTVSALKDAHQRGQRVVLLCQRVSEGEPTIDNLYRIGTIATIKALSTQDGTTYAAHVMPERRVKVTELYSNAPFYTAQCELFDGKPEEVAPEVFDSVKSSYLQFERLAYLSSAATRYLQLKQEFDGLRAVLSGETPVPSNPAVEEERVPENFLSLMLPALSALESTPETLYLKQQFLEAETTPQALSLLSEFFAKDIPNRKKWIQDLQANDPMLKPEDAK